MTIRSIDVKRFSAISQRPFTDVLATIDAAIGHPDANALRHLATASTYAELESVARSNVGPSDLLEFMRFDIGEILRKANAPSARRSVRLIVGSPLIMKQMVEHVPDAASYTPVTILVDEREDGVHLSYDRIASLLDPYGNGQALSVARDVDGKIEALLVEAGKS
jgi:hypothetical protein